MNTASKNDSVSGQVFFFLEINHVNLEVQQLRCRIADSHPPSRECVLSHLGLDKHPWRLVFTPGRFG